MPFIRRALISVSDKRGLVDFAKALQGMGVEIISTGGTLAVLAEHGVKATPVSAVTDFPEILDGRVKTLHPKIHAGLLAVTENEHHREQLEEYGIDAIDMVVVNLYPFERTVARNGIPLEEALEQIDIGGPAMIRSAAKNFKNKAVITSPDRYQSIITEMKTTGGSISEATCFALAREVFQYTSAYDGAISRYLDHVDKKEDSLPSALTISSHKSFDLRYGENPHQRAALYGAFDTMFQHLHGKELSYNNITDMAAAAALVAEFDEPTVAIVKHANPCGVGSGDSILDAYLNALATDPKSAFGGIVATNRPFGIEAAERMHELFIEVIVAPAYSEEVLEFLQRKKERRLIRLNVDLRSLNELEIRSVPGGLLVQEQDKARLHKEDFRIVSKRKPTEEEFKSMVYAWRVAKHVKSNAIVYARHDRTIGIGAGQMSRVDSARLAAQKAAQAGLDLSGTAVGSDAFFPFADGVLECLKAGATAVVHPGGSVRDNEVIEAADAQDAVMACTGVRHFRH